MLWVFGADGLVTRIEQFDADRDAEALARFDELTAEPPAARFANAATRVMDRFERCWCERDWDGMVATLAPAHRLDDRRRLVGLPMSAEESVASLRFVFEVLVEPDSQRAARHAGRATGAVPRADHRPGRRFRSDRGRVSPVVGARRRRPAGRDRGLRPRRPRRRLRRARRALRRRRGRSLRGTLAGGAALVTSLAARDWEQVASVFTPDFVVRGPSLARMGHALARRVPGAAPRAGRAGARRHGCAAITSSPSIAAGCSASGGGSEAERAGAFEIPIVSVMVLGPDGRIRRLHTYDLDQLDAARACFDELTAEPPRGRAHRERRDAAGGPRAARRGKPATGSASRRSSRPDSGASTGSG